MSGKIKFVKRGGAIAGTISEDDLAAHEYEQAPPDNITTVRAPDLELPNEVNAVYVNRDMDYQQGTQRSRRMTGDSNSIVSIPLPIVLTDEKAKQVADVNLYNQWTGRTTYRIALSRKWSKLEPTDVIDVVNDGVTQRMRLVKKDDGRPGIIRFDAVLEDSAIYTQSGNGAASSNANVQTLSLPVQTLGAFLDIPILRDADDDAGFYLAMCGYRSGWGGAVLFKSSDDGATYVQTTTSSSEESSIGYADSVLGTFTGGHIFDEANTVTVKMISGELSGTTELAVLNGSNVAVLGDEIIQFKNATLVSPGVYTLSGLLRGLRGTERAMTTHILGELFVLADTSSWRRVPATTSEIGLERLYKPISFGMTAQQTSARGFTNNAEGLECLSGVQAGAGIDASSNMTIKWVRRGRYAADWRDNVDIPIGETSESYEVDIMTSDMLTVKRTITASSPTVSYTAAQQTTDFGFSLGKVSVNIYQLSSVVGRGHPLSATIDLKNSPTSTQWRIYCSSKRDAGNYLSIREIEMHATVGGADQCTGGTASADSNNGGPTYLESNAFDNNNTTQWTSANTAFPHWIQYTFASAVSVAELSIRIAADTEAPKAWQLQYYDGANWIAVYVQTDEPVWTGGEVRLYTI